MDYKILGSKWHTSGTGMIGIVAIKSHEDIWKAYIGIAIGLNEKEDEQHIAKLGNKLNSRVASAYFPNFDINNYGE